MAIDKTKLKYIPGTYARKRPDSAQVADQYITEWSQRQLKLKGPQKEPTEIAPAICFSRKVGAGALEIADRLGEVLQYRVVDRELLEHVAQDRELSKKTVEFFDERYPGKMLELGSMLFGEKSFIMSDYIRQIVSAVFTFANWGSTIFVGRGVHLILPRERLLAVRIICSDNYRIERLARILDVEDKEAEKLLRRIDQEQRAFFKKAFGKKDATPYEFDLTINSDFIGDPQKAAQLVECAFRGKFAAEFEAGEVAVKKQAPGNANPGPGGISTGEQIVAQSG